MGFTRRLILMARRHWGTLLLATLGILGAALLNLVTPEVVRRLTAALERGGLTDSLLWGLVLALPAPIWYGRCAGLSAST